MDYWQKSQTLMSASSFIIQQIIWDQQLTTCPIRHTTIAATGSDFSRKISKISPHYSSHICWNNHIRHQMYGSPEIYSSLTDPYLVIHEFFLLIYVFILFHIDLFITYSLSIHFSFLYNFLFHFFIFLPFGKIVHFIFVCCATYICMFQYVSDMGLISLFAYHTSFAMHLIGHISVPSIYLWLVSWVIVIIIVIMYVW